MIWGLLLAIPIGAITACQMYEYGEREKKWSEAQVYCDKVGKPLLNVGAGGNIRFIGDVNLDIEESVLPNYEQGTIYEIPYPDKYFGAAVAFHVLEHVENPKAALAEMERVADRVYALVPLPFNPLAWAIPTHKYVFLSEDPVRIHPGGVILGTTTLVGSAIGMNYLAKKGKGLNIGLT